MLEMLGGTIMGVSLDDMLDCSVQVSKCSSELKISRKNSCLIERFTELHWFDYVVNSLVMARRWCAYCSNHKIEAVSYRFTRW